MSIRSTTPSSSCSAPIGISVATTCCPNAGLQRLEAAKEVRALTIEHVHEEQAGHSELVGPFPEALRADLDAHHPVDHEHGALADAERRQRVRHEARVARRVEQVDLPVVPVEGGEARRDRHLACLLVLRGVGDRGPVGHRAEAVDGARFEQQRLVERRLAAAAVAHQRYVADPLGLVVRHANRILTRVRQLARLGQRISLQARLEPQHRLGVELRDARLGDAEDFPDLP